MGRHVIQASAKKKRKSPIIDFTKLKLFEKIRLATLGNAYCRQTLLRDSNKLVAMAVIRSPSGQHSVTPVPATSSPQAAVTAGPAGAGAPAVSIAKPGKQVSQSPVDAPRGRGTRSTSSTAPQPDASASMPRVPAIPAIETSLAAAGLAFATESSSSRNSGVRRKLVESH